MRKVFLLMIALVFLYGGNAAAALTDNGDGTVTDSVTGLMWQKATAPGTYTWQQALSYCENLTLAGHADWRLPNRNELQSLVDYSRYYPAIDPLLAADSVSSYSSYSSYYWSSTTNAGYTDHAWVVDFYNGFIYYGHKSYSYYVRAVRAGQSGSFGSLVLSKSGGGTGTVTSSPAGINCGSQCSASYATGTTVILTATADAGSTFVGWSGGGCQGAGTCEVTVTTTSMQVAAVFTSKTENSLSVKIYDRKTGAPLNGATVTLDNKSATTDNSGSALISGLSPGQHNLVIVQPGFNTYQKVVNIFSVLSKMVFSLTPTVSGNKPVVTDVRSLVSNNSKKALFLDNIDLDLNFSADVNWNGKTPGTIRFITPLGVYNESSGSHVFNMGKDFGPGGRLTVIAISADSTQSEPFDANIEVMNSSINGFPQSSSQTVSLDDNDFSYKFSFSFGSPASALIPGSGKAVPDEIPFFGGEDISFGAVAELSAYIGSDGVFRLSLVGKKTNDNAFKLGGVSFDLGGSLGGEIIAKYQERYKMWITDGGHVLLGIEAQKSIGPSYKVVPVGPIFVPVYFKGEINAHLNAALGISGWSEDQGWQLDGTLEPGIGGKAIVGAGVSGALSIEGYAGLDASLLLSYPVAPYLREASVVLSGGITATALVFQYQQPLLEYKWGWIAGAAGVMPFKNQSAMILGMQNADFKPIPRKYNSGIVSIMPKMKSSVLQAGTNGEQTLPGQTNIYPYSYPEIISLGDDLLLVWITDDLTKTINNRTSLIFSRYQSGDWSTPVKVAESGKADFYPTLAATTSGAIAAWQNSGATFGDEATLDDILPQQEITVATYNTATESWSSSTRLTTNAYLDRTPQAAADGDKAAVVWIANEHNDMLGSAAKPNSLHYSFFNGASWSAASTIAAGLGAIVKSSLSYRGNAINYVFAVDADGDLSTNNDQDIYAVSFDGSAWSAVTRLTETTVQNTNPQLQYDTDGNLLLVWYQDGQYKMVKNMDMADVRTVLTPGLSSGASDFRLVAGANGQLFIVWPESTPDGQDIYMAPYDPVMDVWGKGTRLTDSDDEPVKSQKSFNTLK